MSIRKYFIVEVLVLVLMNVCHIRSGCSWEKTKSCSLNCKSTSPILWPLDKIEDIMKSLTEEYERV